MKLGTRRICRSIVRVALNYYARDKPKFTSKFLPAGKVTFYIKG